ncbi:MAG TPA: hypothetical protein VHW00_20015 [Thermoanaerobaculia bacterium]|nr:hypothetical protein [Thermoanaerobaculia bacterium]
MNNTPRLRLRTWNAEEARPIETQLALSGSGGAASVNLRCIAGASSVHVVLSDKEGIRVRAEIGADSEELVTLRVELDDAGLPTLRSRGRNVLLLPTEERYEPPSPIQRPSADAPLDLALVIDGTLRHWDAAPTQSTALLEHKELWGGYVEKLVAIVREFSNGRDTRSVIVAFGDQELPGVSASDLKPRYHLLPRQEDAILQAINLASIQDRLVSIPPTPGGDFVDALADALAMCSRLHWRDDARKVVIVCGDSPGASLLNPFPHGAELCARHRDVDTESLRLHRQGVEILTIHHAPATPRVVRMERDLLAAARDQYTRLASLPEMALSLAGLDPGAVVSILQRVHGSIGRGPALGMLPDANPAA